MARLQGVSKARRDRDSPAELRSPRWRVLREQNMERFTIAALARNVDQQRGQSLTEYVADWRLREAKRLLLDPANDCLTVEGLGATGRLRVAVIVGRFVEPLLFAAESS